jgi:hypothetical protein
MRTATVAIVVALCCAACSHGSRVETGEPSGAQRGEATTETAAFDAGTTQTTPSANPVAPDPSAVTPIKPPATVKVMVRTNPAKGVWVYWGKK